MHIHCTFQAQQMTMQAIAIQQQMLSSFPSIVPAPQTPSLQHRHPHSPVSRHAVTLCSDEALYIYTPGSMYANQRKQYAQLLTLTIFLADQRD